MAARWIECVPNISEGVDQEIIDSVVAAAASIDGVAVLGCEPDPDYNRTVITLAGEWKPTANAALSLIRMAANLIDMREHSGNHPRMGAVDVCPFVPISPDTQEDCLLAANFVLDQLNGEVPVFLYGDVSTSENRSSLAKLRRGQYEGLEARFTGGQWNDETTRMPDSWSGKWGESEERFGAVAVGVRPVLVAYNVNVDEPVPVASKAAGSLVRTSGRLIKSATGEKVRARGMLDAVQGMGVPLPSHNICQVSMNLQNHAITPMHLAFECVKSICADHDVQLCGSELVGLVPLQAMLDSGNWYSSESETDEQILVQAAIEGLGLNYLAEFDPQTRIIEWAITNQLGD